MDKETERALDKLVDGAMDNGCDTNGAYTSMTDVADAVYKAYEMGRKSVRPEERLREAESVILRLTMDHNSSPNYVLGFEEAREYFCKYPPLPPQSSPQPDCAAGDHESAK